MESELKNIVPVTALRGPASSQGRLEISSYRQNCINIVAVEAAVSEYEAMHKGLNTGLANNKYPEMFIIYSKNYK